MHVLYRDNIATHEPPLRIPALAGQMEVGCVVVQHAIAKASPPRVCANPQVAGSQPGQLDKTGLMKLAAFKFSLAPGFCLARKYASRHVPNNPWHVMALSHADRRAICQGCSDRVVRALRSRLF
jgi:hypothetical protein